MVYKKKLNNLQDWQDWHDLVSERFGFNIINGDTQTPMSFPCIVSWYEYEDCGFFENNDICAYNFIYLSDFIVE